jgi:hypothetical protein
VRKEMIDEDKSERVYRRENILGNLLKRTKESLVNEIYNGIISEELAEDGIPYMGWFWRNCDFIKKDVSIGRDHADNVGIMENNKWDYLERRMTEVEVDNFIRLIDRVLAVDHGFSDDITFYRHKRLKELQEWVQDLKV